LIVVPGRLASPRQGRTRTTSTERLGPPRWREGAVRSLGDCTADRQGRQDHAPARWHRVL